MTDLSLTPATDLVAGYRSGDLSPVDATQAALDAIARYDDAVNAFVLVDAEGALTSARASERRWAAGAPLGPVDGVPVSIKDMLLTAGWPTRRGSTLIPAEGDWSTDAPSVARLRESGAVLLGKTTTPEFAWKGVTDSIAYGATGNPWGAGLTSGGSSGGSATAVGLGMGALSPGTDGGGSVRIPAAFTGTVALKPTYGLVPTYPASPYGTLSHCGPMARNVRDTALMLDVISGFDARDWSAMPTPATSFLDDLDAGLGRGIAGLRVAYSPDLGHGINDPEVDRLVREAVDVLAGLGAEVTELGRRDLDLTGCLDAFLLLWFTGAGKVLEPFGPDALDRIDPLLAEQVRKYASASASDYLDATTERMDVGRRMSELHETYDVLVTPTLPITAFATGQDAPDGWPSQLWPTWTPYTWPFNLTQQPALTVPCGLTSERLPVGLQVVGPRHGDNVVLRVGAAYEAAAAWQLVPTLISQP